MDETIRRAITDLLALSKDADAEDAERIHEIIRRLQGHDAHDDHAMRLFRRMSR